MTRSTAFTLKVTLVVFLLGEAIALTGIVPAPHEEFTLLFRASNAFYVIGFFLGHVHFLHVMFRPGWREYALTAAVGIALAALVFTLDPQAASRSTRDLSLLLFTGLGAASLLAFGARALFATGLRRAQGREMLAIALLLELFGLVGVTCLYLTGQLHPITFDVAAFHIDGTFGFQPSVVLALVAAYWPIVDKLMVNAYDSILLCLIALVGLQATSSRRLPVNMLEVYLLSGLFAYVLYHLCPISGPRFLFEGLFPHSVPAAELVPIDMSFVKQTARNAMPSMHFAAALLAWMNAAYFGRWARALFALIAGLTVLATLGLGEHYLVDLVAGVRSEERRVGKECRL